MRILIADDDAVSLGLLEECITAWGHEAVTCTNGADAMAIMDAPDAPRLAILDWIMPGMEGPEICRRLRSTPRGAYTQIILVTIRGQTPDVVEGLDAGADDYLTKPFNPRELRSRLNAAIRTIRGQDALLAAQQALQDRVRTDSLTGARSRMDIEEMLEKELQQAHREGTTVGVALVDVDRFKNVNDTWGHPAGDEVLRSIVRSLRKCLRPYDGVGRFGGDELLVILPDIDGALNETAQRLRKAVGAQPVEAGKNTIHMTISIGVMAVPGRECLTSAEVMADVDTALREAKAAGRDCVRAFQPAATGAAVPAWRS
jgi:two-component system, cell cycle response regulator